MRLTYADCGSISRSVYAAFIIVLLLSVIALVAAVVALGLALG